MERVVSLQSNGRQRRGRAAPAVLVLMLLLAGCASTEPSEPLDLEAEAEENEEQHLWPADYWAEGRISYDAGGCSVLPLTGHPLNGMYSRGTQEMVPEEAWGRPYEGPFINDTRVEAGDLCTFWYTARHDGSMPYYEVLDSSKGDEGGTVPEEATGVFVAGDLHSNAHWSIHIRMWEP